MRRRTKIVVGILLLLTSCLYLANASWLAPAPEGRPSVLAHRGVHQTFSPAGLTDTTCTAARINPPTNSYLENTIPSMRASFAAGATIVEVDVQPTTDGEIAVFHDWGLDCRTNGHGVTREHSMAELRALDVGYGYTADRGRTYPFRGKGVGLMPTLHEVMTAFPQRTFLINIKSNDPSEADRLVTYLIAHRHPTDERLWVFADGRPVDRLLKLAPRAVIMSKQRWKVCALGYLAIGWTGQMPSACRQNVLPVPMNMRWLYWGWPDRLLARAESAGVRVMLLGPVRGRSAGMSDPSQLEAVPTGFSGLIMTDEIELIGPAVQQRWRE